MKVTNLCTYIHRSCRIGPRDDLGVEGELLEEAFDAVAAKHSNDSIKITIPLAMPEVTKALREAFPESASMQDLCTRLSDRYSEVKVDSRQHPRHATAA